MTAATLVRPRSPARRRPPQGVRIAPPGLPKSTLGWQVIDWCTDYLEQPDGPNARSPWTFTDEQIRFVLWWYAVDEEGRFIYRRGVLRRMKGWGKDPVGAALCAAEFVGPCRFGGWQSRTEPLAVPHPAAWVQTAAVAKEQTRNTMTLFPALFGSRPRGERQGRAIREFGIDLGKEIIYAEGGRRRIEAVTSSPRAVEGGRTTFTLANETHHWIASNEGHAMAAVIARNAAKSRDGASRVLSITNAHVPGEDSEAERDWDAYQQIAAGRSRAAGFLYDSLEAPPTTDLSDPQSLRDGLIAARGDSTWLDVDRLIDEIHDPTTSPSTARRFYLNQVVAAEDAWIAPHEWDACRVPPREVGTREIVVLGFDGSKSRDHTVLDAIRVEDGYAWPLGVWDPERYADGIIPTAEVDAAVQAAFERYDVAGFYADVHEWESYLDAWEHRYSDQLCARSTDRHPIRWDMRRDVETVRAAEAYHDAIVERQIAHGGDARMDQYHYNARRSPKPSGVTFRKESANSSRKIDGVAARMLAWRARQDYLALPENRRRNTRRAGVMFV